MVYVPSAERFGFSLRIFEAEASKLLNGPEVTQTTREVGGVAAAAIGSHIQATASPDNAANYVESMFVEDSFSDDYGFQFDGPNSLGNRPIVVIGVPAGRGVNPAAMPPMQLEARHHALTAIPGVEVGGQGEDIR